MIYMITGETQQRAGVGKKGTKTYERRENGVREAGDCDPPVPPPHQLQKLIEMALFFHKPKQKVFCKTTFSFGSQGTDCLVP